MRGSGSERVVVRVAGTGAGTVARTVVGTVVGTGAGGVEQGWWSVDIGGLFM